jgi:hypothetical protein
MKREEWKEMGIIICRHDFGWCRDVLRWPSNCKHGAKGMYGFLTTRTSGPWGRQEKEVLLIETPCSSGYFRLIQQRDSCERGILQRGGLGTGQREMV